MTLDRKRWALRARELRFSQLEIARSQAETWRTGLAALTGLLTAVFVLKGRDNVSDLAEPAQRIVVAGLGVALLVLLAATLLVSRALAGRPGEEMLLSPLNVERWTYREAARISAVLRWAIRLAATGVGLVAAAVMITWLAPAQDPAGPLARVSSAAGEACGTLAGASRGQLIIQTSAGAILIPLTTVAAIKPVAGCG